MTGENSVLMIGVEGEIIFLALYQGINQDRVVVDRGEWKNDGSSSEELLSKIDLFLKKNGLSINGLAGVETKIDENEKYTLARIIETVVNTVNYCLKVRPSDETVESIEK
jgi:hypothetical protein